MTNEIILSVKIISVKRKWTAFSILDLAKTDNNNLIDRWEKVMKSDECIKIYVSLELYRSAACSLGEEKTKGVLSIFFT